jgi:hypothetical protein
MCMVPCTLVSKGPDQGSWKTCPGSDAAEQAQTGQREDVLQRVFCRGICPQCADIGYNPFTHFKNHLLTSCPAFRNNAAYWSAEVLDELKKAASAKAMVRIVVAIDTC